jgi:hypothetical protein
MFQLVQQSQSYTHSCTGSPSSTSLPEVSDAGGPGGSGGSRESEAFIWGSNSSRQLSDSPQDKFLVPKLTTAFNDVQRMEAGQFCTFIIHTDGKVTACGKGSYGRLELGDNAASSSSSNSHSRPRSVDIPGT